MHGGLPPADPAAPDRQNKRRNTLRFAEFRLLWFVFWGFVSPTVACQRVSSCPSRKKELDAFHDCFLHGRVLNLSKIVSFLDFNVDLGGDAAFDTGIRAVGDTTQHIRTVFAARDAKRHTFRRHGEQLDTVVEALWGDLYDISTFEKSGKRTTASLTIIRLSQMSGSS